jgi:allantoate deiminase
MDFPEARIERIEAHIKTLATFTSTPGSGCTRLTYSKEYSQALGYLKNEMERVGLTISVDPVGTVRARLAGRNPRLAPVLTGSHIDSVFHGGNYDGAAGVVCALEALAAIQEAGIVPERPLELIIFPEEEGPNFGSPLAGSKALTGIYDVGKLKSLENEAGVSMYQAAMEYGLEPDAMPAHILRSSDVHAMIELHVEQSIVLDSENIPLGVVTGIAGMRWVRVRIGGTANHAGATPMKYRSDPMAGAALVISEVEHAARFAAGERTVATVGRISCAPNAPNIIPEAVEFTVDVRDIETSGIEKVIAAVTVKLEEVCADRSLEYEIQERKVADPTVCAPLVVEALKSAAGRRGYPFLEMMSGALHDAAVMAGITPTGMLFLPSVGGRSHVPEERTDHGDIVKGCNVLIGALMELSTS